MKTASVVVCSRDQAPRLRLVLRGLSAQGRAPLEVIVSDDGSSDETSALLAEAEGWLGTELVVVSSRVSRGAPAARNAGARRARGDVIVFLDGDAVPAPDLVESHLALAPAVAFGALWHTPFTEHLRDPIRGERFDGARADAADLVREDDVVSDFASFAGRARPGTYPPLAWAEREGVRLGLARDRPAAWVLMSPQNLSLPRDVFEDIGGFDEALGFCEGWDLVLRARDAGLELLRTSAAIYHLYHRRPLDSFEQALVRWRAVCAIARKREDPSLLLALVYYAACSGNPLIPAELALRDTDALASAMARVRREGMGPYGLLLRGHPIFSELTREARP